jgi:hypothetical protein
VEVSRVDQRLESVTGEIPVPLEFAAYAAVGKIVRIVSNAKNSEAIFFFMTYTP